MGKNSRVGQGRRLNDTKVLAREPIPLPHEASSFETRSVKRLGPGFLIERTKSDGSDYIASAEYSATHPEDTSRKSPDSGNLRASVEYLKGDR